MIKLVRTLFVLIPLAFAFPAFADFTGPGGGPPGGGGPIGGGGSGGGGSGGGSSGVVNSSEQAISNSAIVIGSLASMAGSAVLDDDVVDVGSFVQYSLVPCAASGGAVYLVVASGGAATSAVIVGVVVYYAGRYFLEIFPPHASFRPTLIGKYPHLSDAEIQFRCSEIRKNRYRSCEYEIPGITVP